MKDYVISRLLDEFKSGKLTSKEAVLKLLADVSKDRSAVIRRLVEKIRLAKALDWTYQYSDDPNVYERGVVRWEDINNKAKEDDLLALALAVVGKEVYEKAPTLVVGIYADWGTDGENLHFDGRTVPFTETVEISYGVSFRKRYAHVDESGTVLLIDPPTITKEMVVEAASNGVPVVKWHNWGFASAYADSEQFYGWRLLVRPYDRGLTKGAIFVVPTITDTRRIHRAGKIKHIAEISGQPLIWAKAYYSRSKSVKYAIEDGVVAKVANYSGSTYEEWKEMAEDNSRARAAKRMVALLNQFEGA